MCNGIYQSQDNIHIPWSILIHVVERQDETDYLHVRLDGEIWLSLLFLAFICSFANNVLLASNACLPVYIHFTDLRNTYQTLLSH